MNIGSTLFYRQEFDKSIEYYQKSAKIYEEIKNFEGISNCNNNIAAIYMSRLQTAKDTIELNRMFDTIFSVYNKNMMLAKKMNNNMLLMYCYQNIGSAYMLRNNFEKALENYKLSLDCVIKSGDKVNTARLYLIIGNFYQQNNKQNEAVEYLNHSLEYYTELNDEMGIIRCNQLIAGILFDQGGYDEALEKYFNALKLYEAKNLKEDMASIYRSIGNIYWNLKNIHEAKCYLLKSISLYEELKIYQQQAGVYMDMGNIYTDIANEYKINKNKVKQADSCFIAAQVYYDKTYEIAKQFDDKGLISIYYTNYGNLFQSTNHLKKALELYNKALAYSIENNINDQLDICYSNLGEVCLAIADSLPLVLSVLFI